MSGSPYPFGMGVSLKASDQFSMEYQRFSACRLGWDRFSLFESLTVFLFGWKTWGLSFPLPKIWNSPNSFPLANNQQLLFQQMTFISEFYVTSWPPLNNRTLVLLALQTSSPALGFPAQPAASH